MAEGIADVLRARRIELLDADDVVRAVLHCSGEADDAAYFELFTPKRSGSLVVLADATGVEATLWHRGDTAAALSMDADGNVTWQREAS